AALIGAVRSEATSRNVALLGLDVWSFNAGARAFFQRQGFAPYNERLWGSVSEAGGESAGRIECSSWTWGRGATQATPRGRAGARGYRVPRHPVVPKHQTARWSDTF